ncbi:MAG: hypothetical protein V4451_04810 [Pseudomonadota bacterium]
MAHYTDSRAHEQPLTKKDVTALAWAVKFTLANHPLTHRRVDQLAPELRKRRELIATATKALKKVRELKGQGL